MRSIYKPRLVLLACFKPKRKKGVTPILTKSKLFSGVAYLRESFAIYSGRKFLRIRFRRPYLQSKITSFVRSRTGDLWIFFKYRFKAMKKNISLKKKK